MTPQLVRRLAVAIRRWVLFLLQTALISMLAGCGGGTSDVQNPPPPPPSKLVVAFQPAPATSIPISTTTDFTAIVSDDPSNTGVDWSVTCQNTGNCGSLSSLHTNSGQPTTYTPPQTLSGNSQTVDVVAFATSDHTKNVVAPITVTAFGSNLKGNYVLQAQGIDSSLGAYEFAGVVVLDGNGGISSGEQTVNFFDQNPEINSLVSKSDRIIGGSYFLGSDGRGTIIVNTADTDIGGNGTESFAFVLLSNSQALISQADFALPGTPPANVPATGVSATGTMDLQGSTIMAPLGGYAFAVSGNDFVSGSPTAIGGVLNIDSPNNISGKGSTIDQFLAFFSPTSAKPSGTVSNPDSFGAITFNLSVPTFPSTTAFQFTGYIVDATHIKLIESDDTISAGGIGLTGGVAIGQGSATGTFLDDTSFSGTYVFGVPGVDLSGTAPNTMTSVGLFTADGSGNLVNGFTDTFLQQNGAQGNAGAQISAAFSGKYSVDTKGTGRVRVTFDHLIPAPRPGFQPVFLFYLTGNGNPPLVLESGDATNYPCLGAGIAYPQSPGAHTFAGKYGFSFTQQNGSENDGTAQMIADPTAKTLSGSADSTLVSAGDSNPLDHSFSATFTAPLSNGIFTGDLSNSTGSAFINPVMPLDYYIIDPSHGFFVETDLVDPNLPSGTVSFGYYAVRNSACDGCP
jgi:hypothetical protein